MVCLGWLLGGVPATLYAQQQAAEHSSLIKEPAKYSIEITGNLPKEVVNFIQTHSVFLSQKHDTVRHASALRHRLHEAVPQIQELLDQKGYYDAQVTYAVVKNPRTAQGQRSLSVTLHIDRGQQYILEHVDVQGIVNDVISEQAIISFFQKEKPFNWEQIIQARQSISSLLRHKGYAFHQWSDPHLTVDHKACSVSVRLAMELGPQVYFGPAHVTGLKNTHEDFIRNRFLWTEGDLLDDTKIKQTKKDLTDLDLFSSVMIQHGDRKSIQSRKVPIHIDVTEQHHRYMGAGLKYSQISRIGGKVFWGHNNFWGRGERFEISYKSSHIERAALIQLKKPDFLQRGQKLTHTLTLGHDNTPAYIRRYKEVAVSIARDLTSYWHIIGGGVVSNAQVLNIDADKNMVTWGAPFHLQYGRTNHAHVDTSSEAGWHAVFTWAPYWSVIKDQSARLSSLSLNSRRSHIVIFDHRVKISGQYPLMTSRFMVAGWGEAAMMRGARFQEIPADRRYYAGGIGSVRGYALQKAEKFSTGSQPQGGQALIQWGGEARIRCFEHMSAVFFLEGAKLSRESWRHIMKSATFQGYGAGMRYHSELGLFRFDLALPAHRRSGIDSAFEFYAGLGQAF